MILHWIKKISITNLFIEINNRNYGWVKINQEKINEFREKYFIVVK